MSRNAALPSAAVEKLAAKLRWGCCQREVNICASRRSKHTWPSFNPSISSSTQFRDDGPWKIERGTRGGADLRCCNRWRALGLSSKTQTSLELLGWTFAEGLLRPRPRLLPSRRQLAADNDTPVCVLRS